MCDRGGSTSQFIPYLLPDASAQDSNHNLGGFLEKITGVADSALLRECGRSKVDQTLPVLVSGKLVKQKKFMCVQLIEPWV